MDTLYLDTSQPVMVSELDNSELHSTRQVMDTWEMGLDGMDFSVSDTALQVSAPCVLDTTAMDTSVIENNTDVMVIQDVDINLGVMVTPDVDTYPGVVVSPDVDITPQVTPMPYWQGKVQTCPGCDRRILQRFFSIHTQSCKPAEVQPVMVDSTPAKTGTQLETLPEFSLDDRTNQLNKFEVLLLTPNQVK